MAKRVAPARQTRTPTDKKKRHRQTDRHRSRDTERQRGRQTERQGERFFPKCDFARASFPAAGIKFGRACGSSSR